MGDERWMLVAGCWWVGAGCWVLVAGSVLSGWESRMLSALRACSARVCVYVRAVHACACSAVVCAWLQAVSRCGFHWEGASRWRESMPRNVRGEVGGVWPPPVASKARSALAQVVRDLAPPRFKTQACYEPLAWSSSIIHMLA